MKTIQTKDLRLADIVLISKDHGNPYHCATVRKIEKGVITFFRPYVKTEDFEYTGGVICYVGVEHFSIFAGESTIELLERKTLK